MAVLLAALIVVVTPTPVAGDVADLAQPDGDLARAATRLPIDRSAASGIDRWSDDGSTVDLVGWVDTGGRRARVIVEVDGRRHVAVPATIDRPDVDSMLVDGGARGFRVVLDELGFGTFEVCARANWRDTEGGRRVDLGCRRHWLVPPRTAPPRGRLVIHGTGDVQTDPLWFTRPDGVVDYRPLLDGMEGLFGRDDLTVINVECAPSARGRPVPKRFNFRCSEASLAELAREGVDAGSLANNHAIDFGMAAMLDGIDNMVEAGIAPVGAGPTATDAWRPALFERHGWRIAVFGSAQFVEFDWWFAGRDSPGVANANDLRALRRAIEAWDPLVDVVVVGVHWGIERSTIVPPAQAHAAQVMVDAGADVVFGHHPHVLQRLDRIGDAAVFHSLGNFVWFHLGGPYSRSAVGRVEFRPEGTVRACLLRSTITAPGRVTLDDPDRTRCPRR